LIEFSVLGITEFDAGPTKVMRAHDDTDALSVVLHGVEHALWRQAIGGDLAQARHSTQKRPAFDLGG
jgi:predicted dinucleotide-binding enzyme